MSAVLAPRPSWRVLASERRTPGWDPGAVVRVDRPGRGAVALRPGPGHVTRAEPGPEGPLRLDARYDGRGLRLEVRGPAGTPPEIAERALAALAGWVGADDEPDAGRALLARNRGLERLARLVGPVRLAALPRVGEAFDRAVIAQLVQASEARRSMRQVVALAGMPDGAGLATWPEPAQIGRTPAWALRRCGISLRAARALHAGAVEARRLEAARGDRRRLDARLCALPGVGVWTAAKTRAALGDPDAVPVGDWNLPARVCTALTGEHRGRRGWSDEDMLELLDPFTGQRARVIRLLLLGARLGHLPQHRRRAPRAPHSAHRYF